MSQNGYTKKAQTNQHEIEIGQRFPLTIKRLGINGEGIGYYKRTIVFVEGALPTEVITAEVTSVAPRFVYAKIKKIRQASDKRVTPPCEYYDECGGCQLQHLAYQGQLDFKKDVVQQSLEKFKPKGYQDFNLLPTLGMENPYGYRNKAQFQIRKNSDDEVIAGLYRENSHEVIDLKTCLVQHPATMDVMLAVKALLQELEIPVYNEEKNSGIVKTIMIREGFETGELQLVFITNSKKLPKKYALITAIEHDFPNVVSIMQNVNPGKTSVVFGDETLHLSGKETISEKLNEISFELSARAFYQLNPEQTKVLYHQARFALDLAPNETVVDAYCGVGTIGLSLAAIAKEVRGMDVIPEAIADAQKNIERNSFSNMHYEVGTAEAIFPKWLEEGFRPDALVVDPPRTGLDAKLIQAILQVKPKKMVYVSCNPSTLARDLVELTRIYHVEYIQSVDLFPQTARCEAVVKLRLK